MCRIIICCDLELQQCFTEPTRSANGHASVWDLLFYIKRDIISAITAIPGISDHKAVIVNLKCYKVRGSIRARKHFPFDRGDYPLLYTDLLEFLQEFLFESDSRAANTLWHIFKTKILFLTEKHISLTVHVGKISLGRIAKSTYCLINRNASSHS